MGRNGNIPSVFLRAAGQYTAAEHSLNRYTLSLSVGLRY